MKTIINKLRGTDDEDKAFLNSAKRLRTERTQTALLCLRMACSSVDIMFWVNNM